MLRAFYAPGTLPSVFNRLSLWILKITLWNRCSYCPYFRDENWLAGSRKWPLLMADLWLKFRLTKFRVCPFIRWGQDSGTAFQLHITDNFVVIKNELNRITLEVWKSLFCKYFPFFPPYIQNSLHPFGPPRLNFVQLIFV